MVVVHSWNLLEAVLGGISSEPPNIQQGECEGGISKRWLAGRLRMSVQFA